MRDDQKQAGPIALAARGVAGLQLMCTPPEACIIARPLLCLITVSGHRAIGLNFFKLLHNSYLHNFKRHLIT